jgi:diguanylate cyclase (GGDEF)-like protein
VLLLFGLCVFAVMIPFGFATDVIVASAPPLLLWSLLAAVILTGVLFTTFDLALLSRLRTVCGWLKSVKYGQPELSGAATRDEMSFLADAFGRIVENLSQCERQTSALQGELAEQNREAREQSIADGLTGLYSHRYFQRRLGEEVERARRFGHPLALLFCDIDRFKAINDSEGHQTGDEVLQQLGRLIREAIRALDVPARYGGEEFTVILPEATGVQAYEVAERLRRTVSSQPFGGDSAVPGPVTISIGIATYPTDAANREELVDKADKALRLAKQLGRNQVRLYREVASADIAEGSAAEVADPVEVQRIVESAYLDTIHSLAAAVDARDPYTCRHSENVARDASAIAQAMNLSDRELRNIGVAGLLHDVGKIGVPDTVLKKPGPLTKDEWEKVRQHPVLGENIIRHASSLNDIIPFILHHQERFDGQGYPDELAGESIPLGARILAVADAYEAMSSSRPYRPAKDRDDIITELRANAGVQFDPAVVATFLGILEDRQSRAVPGPIPNLGPVRSRLASLEGA